MSHPTWVRGLKQNFLFKYKLYYEVAPYVGAWIETHMFLIRLTGATVAPYVGAWIETLKTRSAAARICRTLRGCVD